MSDSWYRISIRVNAVAHDAIADYLNDHGVPGVVIKRQSLEAYVTAQAAGPAYRRELVKQLRIISNFWPRIKAATVTWQRIKSENWHDSWRRFIKPSRIGKKFWVTPPWLDPPHFRHRQILTIEPGLAFGTGAHATTRSCGEFIEEVFDQSLGGHAVSVLDVGTGSGILAIIAAKLGARRIIATDNDAVALAVARENVSANGVAKFVRLSDRALSQIGGRFSLVVANLTADTILALADGLVRKVGRGGLLILSGILYHQAPQVRGYFVPAGFSVVKRCRRQEWVTLLLKRNAN